MKMEFALLNRHFSDLNPLLCGCEDCEPGHSFGPAVRKYTLIHYVTQGSGMVYKGGESYRVNAGEAFIILPDEVVTYTADPQNPWSYQWIGFDGEMSKKFAELPVVISFPSGVIDEMIALRDSSVREYLVAGLLFRMYAEIFYSNVKKSNNHYVRRVKDYINTLYMSPLRVEEIAQKMNLDRRYLSRLFKERTGQSVQEYLISVRMEEARQRLSEGFSVDETAHLCGYDDAGNFSKMFKRRFGVSPAYWKSEKSRS
ncbi:MAG: AraC family transcriptional regulator [Clostridia bacterium]|nr:AraC family transcriptional regulator [Clostridia bacterium]